MTSPLPASTALEPTVYEPPAAAPAPVESTPRFASVAQRIGSSLIDCVVSIILCIPLFRAEGESRAAAFTWLVVIWAVWLAYQVAVYRRWGQTPGKWAVRTRLVSADGERVSRRQILTRAGFILAIGVLLLPGYWHALGLLHDQPHEALSWVERQAMIEELTPAWGDVVIGGYWLFLGACLVAVLLSRRKQSLHDMVAGTVVISLRAPPAATQPVVIGRWHRVLEVADWTLATLWALTAGFCLLGAWGSTLVPQDQSSDVDVAVKVLLYMAAGSAVLAGLMVLAALHARSPHRTRRAVLHWLAYVLTLLPIALIILGLILKDDGSEQFKSGAPDVVQITPAA